MVGVSVGVVVVEVKVVVTIAVFPVVVSNTAELSKTLVVCTASAVELWTVVVALMKQSQFGPGR